jgi:Tol biopolymer transport system component
MLLRGVLGFEWYRDSRRIVYTRESPDEPGARELCAANLASGEEAILQRGNHLEIATARDGTGVTYVSGASRFDPSLWLLRLDPGSQTARLPKPVGKPAKIVSVSSGGYPRNGGWSPDGKAIVYTRERHDADVYLIENYK